ncbi:MAG: hypothetical protein Q9219_005701 [cf. Caloplaca sp. 3 TL-2023]
MLAQRASPEDLYMTFATNMSTITSDVKNFSKSFQDDRFTDIFKRAQDSRARSNEDIPGWRVTENEDWLEVRNLGDLPNPEVNEISGPSLDVGEERPVNVDDIRKSMENAKKNNPEIDFSLNESSNIIKIALPPQAYTHFEIRQQESSSANPKYMVATVEQSSMHIAMAKAINSREYPNNLDYLLISTLHSLPPAFGPKRPVSHQKIKKKIKKS